jgi:hypothetical protein
MHAELVKEDGQRKPSIQVRWGGRAKKITSTKLCRERRVILPSKKASVTWIVGLRAVRTRDCVTLHSERKHGTHKSMVEAAQQALELL